MSAPGTPGDRRPVDLRLAGFAVATWLSALAGLYGSARLGAVVATTAALAAAAVSGHGLAARLRRYRWVVVGVLLGVVCGSTATAARVVVRDAAPLADLVATGAAVQVDLVARDDPRVVAGPPGRPALHLLAADLTAVRGAGPAPMSPRPVAVRIGAALRLDARVIVLATDPRWRELLPGQRLTATGRLVAPRGGDLSAAVLSATGAPHLLGRPSWAQRVAGSLRAGLQRACAPLADQPGGLLPGLVVGDTSRLDPAVEEDFRATGMTHLNAVSGANVPQTGASSVGG